MVVLKLSPFEITISFKNSTVEIKVLIFIAILGAILNVPPYLFPQAHSSDDYEFLRAIEMKSQFFKLYNQTQVLLAQQDLITYRTWDENKTDFRISFNQKYCLSLNKCSLIHIFVYFSVNNILKIEIINRVNCSGNTFERNNQFKCISQVLKT